MEGGGGRGQRQRGGGGGGQVKFCMLHNRIRFLNSCTTLVNITGYYTGENTSVSKDIKT